MTCIVGYLDGKTKRVTIGGDSAGVGGLNISIRKDTKVFRVGDFVIGCTSSFRMIQLLRFSFEPPEVADKDVYRYMCTEFVNAVRECFKNGGYLQKYTAGDEKGGTFLVAYKDRLFRIEEDFQVGETLDGMDAVGCGADFAIGSLHTLSKSRTDAAVKVRKSLKTAAYFSAGVCEPFVIEST